MIYMRIIFASIALFAVLYMIKFLNSQGIEDVPAAKVLLEQTDYPSHIPLSNATPNSWLKISLAWCENWDQLHYFQTPQNDLWTIQQGKGTLKAEPNCHVTAYKLNEGLKFATAPLLPFHLKVVYLNKKEALFNTDGNGIFEKDGQLYYSLDLTTAMKALAQSASLNQ